MISLKQYFPLCFCWAALVLQGHGQALADNDPPAPVSGILDKSGFFAKNSSAYTRISEQLRKLEQAHGFRIYLVVEPVLIAKTPPEWAAELRQKWLPNGNGIVVVYESDSHNLGIGRDIIGYSDLSGNSARLPSYETTAILNRALETADPDKDPQTFIESRVTNLVGEFHEYFMRLATPPPAERSMKIGLLVIGTLSLLGLAVLGLGALVRHSSMAGVRSFHFPVVDRPERLGAPCGSSVTARCFGPQRPR